MKRMVCLTIPFIFTLILVPGCGNENETTDALTIVGGSESSQPAALPADITGQIRTFCGDCHATPLPESFQKDDWYHEVKRGFNFYTESGRSDLQVPSVDPIVAWFRQQAPSALVVPPLLKGPESSVNFRKTSIAIPASVKDSMVSSVIWGAESESNWGSRLRLCDMRSGTVGVLNTEGGGAEFRELLMAAHPARTLVTDLDGDGVQDLVISELGSQLPADHSLGRITFVTGTNQTSPPVPILEGVGRIADVRPADFDGDGDIDLVVAEFGWMKTGRILLLERTSDPGPLTAASFTQHVIDKRHGTIHVPVVDLNGDNIQDFVALVSQEHETIDVFLGNGDLTFRKETIYAANDPAFGSSGIELKDMDGDGDIDVVYSNGDTLDSYRVKPYHGVHLLINEGSYPFRAKKLVGIPGASATAPGDLDGDGDVDIAVACFLPLQLLDQLPSGKYDTLVWLEQTAPEEFVPHVVENSSSGHLAIATGDFDNNGRVDICVGNYLGEEWGAIWWNTEPSAP